MHVVRFDFHYLHNEEWFRFYTEFKLLALKAGVDTLKIGALFAHLLACLDQADLLLEILGKSSLTAKLINADKDRDNIYRGLRDAVKVFFNFPDPAMQKAAQELILLVEKYKNILSGNYAEETGAIDNFIQDLRGETPGTSAFAQYVGTLSLHVWVDSLENANNTYKALLDERYDKAAEKPLGQLKKLRPVADRYFVAIENVLDAELLAAGYDDDGVNANIESPAPEIADIFNFVKEFNLRIKTYKALVTGRKTRNSNKKGGKGDDDAKGEDTNGDDANE